MILQEPLDKEQEKWIRNQELILANEEILDYSKAGEGNMNVVIRVRTNLKSFILKQSRPFVNRYPQVPAPKERILTERFFYRSISHNRLLAGFSPKMIDFFEKHLVLVLEDLGNTSDFTNIYQDPSLFSMGDAASLILFLKNLHSIKIKDFPDNSAMKFLNHEHIFIFPFVEESGFDLDQLHPGLQKIADFYKNIASLKNAIEELGQRYLASGEYLLHGDFYPGSWMKVSENIKILDPEFAFLGDREFDLGVMFAHLKLAKVPQNMIDESLQLYQDNNMPLDTKLLDQYTGVEILRRLLGLAQLPIILSLEEKERLCQEASSLIL
ncbi:phosphotransferase [Shivajiella indica]|uniref:Phosphotransferase n=1 Tax=Shivajiella indica TaxID=872115 RepID=A0ABW5B6X6_9BACT